MNCEVQENSWLKTAGAAIREFPEACYIRANSRGSYVDAGLLPSSRTL
jgi:hypothetical protein